MGVVDGDVGAAGAAGTVSREDHRELVGGDAYAVVGDQKNDILLFLPAGEDDGAGFGRLLEDSMENGIFYGGLERELGDLVIHQLIGNIGDKGNLVVIAHILKADVDGNMLFLTGDRADAVLFAQGELIEPGEILHGCRDLVRTTLERHPVDHIHGVVEKMGIDLGLEGIKFRNAKILRSFGLFFHEMVHLPGHVVVGVDEVADLVVGGGTVHGNRRPLADFAHPRDDGRNPVGDGAGEEYGQEKGQHHDSEIDYCKLDNQGAALPEQRPRGKNCHHKPSRLADPIEAHIDGLSENFLLDETVGGKGGLVDLVVIQPVDTGEGSI